MPVQKVFVDTRLLIPTEKLLAAEVSSILNLPSTTAMHAALQVVTRGVARVIAREEATCFVPIERHLADLVTDEPCFATIILQDPSPDVDGGELPSAVTEQRDQAAVVQAHSPEDAVLFFLRAVPADVITHLNAEDALMHTALAFLEAALLILDASGVPDDAALLDHSRRLRTPDRHPRTRSAMTLTGGFVYAIASAPGGANQQIRAGSQLGKILTLAHP